MDFKTLIISVDSVLKDRRNTLSVESRKLLELVQNNLELNSALSEPEINKTKEKEENGRM